MVVEAGHICVHIESELSPQLLPSPKFYNFERFDVVLDLVIYRPAQPGRVPPWLYCELG